MALRSSRTCHASEHRRALLAQIFNPLKELLARDCLHLRCIVAAFRYCRFFGTPRQKWAQDVIDRLFHRGFSANHCVNSDQHLAHKCHLLDLFSNGGENARPPFSVNSFPHLSHFGLMAMANAPIPLSRLLKARSI
jgi:hypothetical protein